MRNLATIFLLCISTMATSQTTPPSPEDIMSELMAIYRSREIVEVKRNGVTMLNPYHFYAKDDTAETSQQVVSLLDQIYAAPIDEQASLAQQLGAENDKLGPYMAWDAFVTGHADVYKALSGAFISEAGLSGRRMEKLVHDYRSTRVQKVFDTPTEAKAAAIQTWLDEFQDEASALLFEAAVEGDEMVLGHMIEAGHEIHPADDPSNLPFHAACYNGRLGAAQQLLGAGVDVNHLDLEFGSTALMRAAAGGRTDVVKWLLQHGADPHARETRERGGTALELGMENSSVAQLLLDSGAQWSPVAFASAIHHGNHDSFELAKVLSGFGELGSTPTDSPDKPLNEAQRKAILLSIEHCASKQPAPSSVVRWLLEQLGPSLNVDDVYNLDASDKELLQALHAGIENAIRQNDADTTRLLLDNLLPLLQNQNTNPSLPKDEITLLPALLHTAITSNSPKTTHLLLTTHPQTLNPNTSIGPNSETPLTTAARAGHVDIINLLVSSFAADIHLPSSSPTALWHAIHAQQEGAARALLALGGPVEELHEAVEGGARRVWLVAGAGGEESGDGDGEGGKVALVAWMNPLWGEEGNGERVVCLEFPGGFGGEVFPRREDGDEVGGSA